MNLLDAFIGCIKISLSVSRSCYHWFGIDT